jgi:hypothetical protein
MTCVHYNVDDSGDTLVDVISMLSTRCRCSILDVQYSIVLDARCALDSTRCSAPDARVHCSMLDSSILDGSMIDARCSILNARCSMLDGSMLYRCLMARCLMLDAQCSILDGLKITII